MTLIPISVPGPIQFEIEGFDQENDYITSCMQKFSNWEPNLTEKFLSILKQAGKHGLDGVVLDIGACFGYYSLLAGQSGFRSIAFEPNPRTLQILERNVQLSGKGLIDIRRIGLGESDETKTIRLAMDNIGGSTLVDIESNEDQPIEIKRLDDQAIEEHVLICKIDVEGYEPEVLRGGLETLRRTKADFIFLEISSKFRPVDELIDGVVLPLWKEGYLAFDIGLQDSGKMEEAVRRFRSIPSSSDVRSYLNELEQTNFLFVKKDTPDKILTGSLWKDELLLGWMQESAEEMEQGLKALSIRLDDERKENYKLFEELQKAGAFQQELLNVIQEKDRIINETENAKQKLLQGMDTIRNITNNIT